MPTLVWSSGSQTVIPVNVEQTQTSKNTCTDIRSLLQQSTSTDAFLNNYKLSSANSNQNILLRLQELKRGLEEKVVSDRRGTTEITSDQVDDSVKVETYLQNLESDVRYLRFVNDCLKTYSDRPELQAQKERTEESKIRFESLQTPEERVSYYEGIFPLTRPISETGLFVMFGLALLFLFYSAALFLRMSGIQFDITFPAMVMGSSYGFSFLEGYGPLIIGFVLGIITALFYYLMT